MAALNDVARMLTSTLTPRTYDEYKLHLLCYFSHGLSLAWTATPLLDESFCATQYCPLIYEPPTDTAHVSLITRARGVEDDYETRLTPNESAIIRSVCDFYGPRHIGELITLSHGAAWRTARDTCRDDPSRHPVIAPVDVLKEYASSVINRNRPLPARPELQHRTPSWEDLLAAADAVEERWHEVFSLLARR